MDHSERTRRLFDYAERISAEPLEERMLFKNDDTEDKTDVGFISCWHMKNVKCAWKPCTVSQTTHIHTQRERERSFWKQRGFGLI